MQIKLFRQLNINKLRKNIIPHWKYYSWWHCVVQICGFQVICWNNLKFIKSLPFWEIINGSHILVKENIHHHWSCKPANIGKSWIFVKAGEDNMVPHWYFGTWVLMILTIALLFGANRNWNSKYLDAIGLFPCNIHLVLGWF